MKALIVSIVAILLLAGCVPTPKPVTWVEVPRSEVQAQAEMQWVEHLGIDWDQQLTWPGQGLPRGEVACSPYSSTMLSDCPGCIQVVRNPKNEGERCGILLACCRSGGRCFSSAFVFLGPGDSLSSFVCDQRYDEVWMKCWGDVEGCALSYFDG